MRLQLLEPLRELFKDEVRRLGIELGCARDGPSPSLPRAGLGVRILGEVRQEYAELLRRADAIYVEELRKHDSLRPHQPGVRGLPAGALGGRHGRWAPLRLRDRAARGGDGGLHDRALGAPAVRVLDHVSRRIVNEVPGISRVVYDISSKPPATIEWE